jgi:hypothetical protein
MVVPIGFPRGEGRLAMKRSRVVKLCVALVGAVVAAVLNGGGPWVP